MTHHPVQLPREAPEDATTSTTTPALGQGPAGTPGPMIPDWRRAPSALQFPGSTSDDGPCRPRPGLSDQLAAGALLHALEPGWTPDAAAAALARRAAGDRFALRHALARIQSRSLQRTSPVAERAVSALRLALDPTGSVAGATRANAHTARTPNESSAATRRWER